MSEKIKSKVKLAAIDPIVVSNIVLPTESKKRGSNWISWGVDNKYPNYLWDLYLNVPHLQTIINGTSDFIVGNAVNCTVPNFSETVNSKGETITDILRKISIDKMIFGGYALQIIRNRIGEISEIYHLDFMKIRSDEKNEIFYYSNDWNAWQIKSIRYPRFSQKDISPSSIVYNKGYITRSVYPIPVYGAATIPCETEKNINEFHLNSIDNSFMGSVIINFNNSEPTDEIKEEIEKNINEKFSGYQNAGRILLSFNESVDTKTTVERLDSDDFADRYNSLAERSKEQIFCAFRANQSLFGINYSSGFNENEFNEAFKLYNRTVVRPIQKEIIDTFDKIFGVKGSITIEPFSLTPKGEEDNLELIK